tara:strand:- start:1263 stop:2576 length:1314 start_codon:yes stop_codon:yes gene_type:complete
MNYKKKLLDKEINIAVWGAGYIGLSSMVYFAQKGVICKGFDVDKNKVKKINKGELTIPELKNWFNIDIKKLSKKHFLSATSNYKNLLSNKYKVHLIAIPTEKNGKPYFDILFDVLKKLSPIIKKKTKPIIIIESTLTPKFTDKFIIPYFKKLGFKNEDYILGIAPRRDWFVAKTKTIEKLDRVVGAKNYKEGLLIKNILSIVCKKIHVSSDYSVSEMVKSIENAYRHMEITLANQLSLAYPNENMREVLKLVGTKWNIGTYHPGFGTGGYCIPLSSQYVLREVKDKSKLTLLRETIKTDTNINILIAKSLIQKGYKKIGVLGLSYKGNLKVDILSPVIPFIKYLKSKNVSVNLFDPYYSIKEIKQITGVNSFKYPEDLSKFDCIVISIDHKEFKINMKNIGNHLKNCKYILDNMRVWEKIKFPKNITYKIPGEKNWL